MKTKKTSMFMVALLCIFFLAACANNNYQETDSLPSGITSSEPTQSPTASSQETKEKEPESSSEIPVGKDNIELVKEKRVSDLLTYKTVPNLTLTLNQLFDTDRFSEVTWIDNKDSVRLCVKRSNSDNQIIFNFTIVGSEVDFPSVSTMLQTNDGGIQPVEWSINNIDDAIIKLLISDGFVTDLGGTYKANS